MSTTTPKNSAQLMIGTKIWPLSLSDVCRTLSRGMRPRCRACCDTEKAPEMTAWEAMTVAIVASTTIGSTSGWGARRKNG